MIIVAQVDIGLDCLVVTSEELVLLEDTLIRITEDVLQEQLLEHVVVDGLGIMEHHHVIEE